MLVGAEAEVDDSRANCRRSEDALHDLARLELGALALGGIPRAEQRLRVDADDAEAVGGRRDERSDRGAVLAADAGGLLRVQRLGVGAPEELGMRDVDARVDDRDGTARRRAA